MLTKKLDNWKDIKLNVAICGTSGTGKSSFINAVLGLTADDEGSAEVGVTETTHTVKKYPHPRHNNLVLWDLPGVGTPSFNRENFFNKVNVNYYDFVILLTADRFRDDDIWLARELDAQKKVFYFARNKIGQDIGNDKISHPKSHNETKLLEDIRNNCELNLRNLESKRLIKVYLIDSHETKKYEFDKLIDEMVKEAPMIKQEAMILSMTHLTDNLIEEKKEILSDRIHYMSLLSGISGAIPFPGLDIAVDFGILVEEATFYRDQLGLGDEMLEAYANNFKMSIEQLTSHLDLKSRLIQLSAKGLASYITKKGAKKAATMTTAKYLKYFLPIFGNAVSGSASYGMTSWCLHDLLDAMVEDAKKVNKHNMHIR